MGHQYGIKISKTFLNKKISHFALKFDSYHIQHVLHTQTIQNPQYHDRRAETVQNFRLVTRQRDSNTKANDASRYRRYFLAIITYFEFGKLPRIGSKGSEALVEQRLREPWLQTRRLSSRYECSSKYVLQTFYRKWEVAIFEKMRDTLPQERSRMDHDRSVKKSTPALKGQE